MAEDTRIRGPVSIQSDCKERVAFDLMHQVASFEEKDRNAPRRYWLDLYYQCLQVVNDIEPDSSFQERPLRG